MFEIAKNIYRFPVPLPGSPLKELNGYIVKGADRHLMVDVGFNMPEVLKATTDALKELDISLADTDIFLTHLHADHTGLIEELKKECGKIYISEPDSVHVNRNSEDSYWIECMSIQGHMGFPEDETLDYKDHPAYVGGTLTYADFEYVKEGMRFPYGGYNFEAIDLKGHTPGQMGLFDKETGVFFCGDHILNKITPNINLWDFEMDYLGLFLENLRKVRVTMDVKNLLSAHRAHVDNTNERIDQLIAHHDNRLNNVLSILVSGKQTVYEVAMEVHWDYGGGFFGKFPAAQKWFAASEVFAHLEHLRILGKVDLTIDGLTYKYTVK
jgi:glyoxylase-like metal-dependent hydrolase (beta-lactamase superfamily II)